MRGHAVGGRADTCVLFLCSNNSQYCRQLLKGVSFIDLFPNINYIKMPRAISE